MEKLNKNIRTGIIQKIIGGTEFDILHVIFHHQTGLRVSLDLWCQ